MTQSRRDLLKLAAAGLAGAALSPVPLRAATTSAPSGAAPAPPASRRFGAQLYTVRDQVAKDPAATLRAIKEIGYREVEVLQQTMDVVLPIARSLDLAPVAVHIDPALVLDGAQPAVPTRLAEVAARSRDAGAGYLVLAWIPFERRPAGAAGYKELGAALNRAGEAAKRAGLQFAYHNHAFEFQEVEPSRRALDVIVASTDPALVALELDVFWVAVTGADPVAVLRQHSGRVALVHLKDKAAGVGPALREDQVPRTAFAEVGSGTLDFRAIVAAADAAGAKHYFVEQDHTAGDPIASLRKSYEHLSRL
jgi:sugar phosphate isomerase/epimerase